MFLAQSARERGRRAGRQERQRGAGLSQSLVSAACLVVMAVVSSSSLCSCSSCKFAFPVVAVPCCCEHRGAQATPGQRARDPPFLLLPSHSLPFPSTLPSLSSPSLSPPLPLLNPSPFFGLGFHQLLAWVGFWLLCSHAIFLLEGSRDDMRWTTLSWALLLVATSS